MTSSKQRLEYALMEDQQYLVAGLDRNQARLIASDVARQLERAQITSRNAFYLDEARNSGEPISQTEYGNAIQSAQGAARNLAGQIESAMRQRRIAVPFSPEVIAAAHSGIPQPPPANARSGNAWQRELAEARAQAQARAQERAEDSDNDSVNSTGSNTGTEFTAASSANGFQPAPYPVEDQQDLAWLLQNLNTGPGSVSSRAVSSTGVGGGGPSSRNSARQRSSRHHQERGGGSGRGPR
ncbi:hypothetical protein [Micromonospora sp. SH-82]|uniref:hypothetical protein n=1 Tax=Micromonospora sp. SH-82 TaxID=3132938 RepID=UPI003EBD019D